MRLPLVLPSCSVCLPQAEVPMSNYAFFVKCAGFARASTPVWRSRRRVAVLVRYTYSNECALLAYNFHELVSKLGIFEIFAYRPLGRCSMLLSSEPPPFCLLAGTTIASSASRSRISYTATRQP